MSIVFFDAPKISIYILNSNLAAAAAASSSKMYIFVSNQTYSQSSRLNCDIYFVKLFSLDEIMCVYKIESFTKKRSNIYERSELNSISILIHYISVLRLITRSIAILLR